MTDKTKLLVIDEMALVRKCISEMFRDSMSIEVLAATSNIRLAARRIASTLPDVTLLDVPSPVKEDLHLLRQLFAKHPTPILLLTALPSRDRQIVMDKLNIKSSNLLRKPEVGLAKGLQSMMHDIESAIRQAHMDELLQWRTQPRNVACQDNLAVAHDRVIGIGASTGGTQAISEILSQLPSDTPAIVIVQHMPRGFTRMFAERLNEYSEMEVKEAADGDQLRPGRALVAPSGQQTKVVRTNQGFQVRVESGERVNGHCPSVDVMMQSMSSQVGPRAIGILLTGMGRDGADGMKALRDTGAQTFAQDEESSIVFGMPKQAYQRGGAERLVSLDDIPKQLMLSLMRS